MEKLKKLEKLKELKKLKELEPYVLYDRWSIDGAYTPHGGIGFNSL